MKIHYFFLCSFFLVGCVSLEDCKKFNAYEHGRLHVVKGYANVDFFNKYKTICAQKHQVALSYEEYNKGRKKGIKELCTYQGGYNFGNSGRSNPKLCSKESEPEFMKGYKNGRMEYLEQRVKYLEGENTLLRSDIIIQDTRPQPDTTFLDLSPQFKPDTTFQHTSPQFKPIQQFQHTRPQLKPQTTFQPGK